MLIFSCLILLFQYKLLYLYMSNKSVMDFTVEIYAHGISTAQRCVRIARRNIATKREAASLLSFYKSAYKQGVVTAWVNTSIAGHVNSYFLSKRNIHELFNLLK